MICRHGHDGSPIKIDLYNHVTPPAYLGCPAFEARPGQVTTWMYDGDACLWVAIPPLGDAPVLALAVWSPTAVCADGRRSARAGDWSVQASWVQGLSAWRQQQCGAAEDAFTRVGANASDAEMRAAGLFWSARADFEQSVGEER